MKSITVFIACLLASSAIAQDFDENVSGEKRPWTNLEAKNNPENFQFIIVTDRTGGHRPGVFMDGVRKINLMQPEFVMSVGDLIEGYTEDLERLDHELTEFNGFTEQLDMPFFYLPGNHDISNLVMKEEWEKRFGPTYYHFKYKDVLFLCLNSEDPPSSQMSEEQVAYAKKALEENQDVRWTLVFIHKPLWNYGDPAENGWAALEIALKDRPHNVFAGHTHHYFKHVRNDQEYIVLATMGGGSQLRGPNYGEFDHFMWVTMTDDGPRIANLMLDGIWDTNITSDARMAMIRPALSGATVRIDGIVVDTPEFTEAATTLRITNDADVEMTAEVLLLQDGPVSASKTQYRTTVAPNSVEQFDIKLSATEPVPTASIKPIIAKWNVTYAIEGQVQPVDVRGRHRVVIDQAIEVAQAASDITVDGDLGDWGGLRIVPTEWGFVEGQEDNYRGANDASIRMDVRQNEEFVFVAVDVTDDQYIRDNRPEYWRRDSMVIAIDARPEGERHGGAVNKDYIQLALIPDLEGGGLASRDSIPEGVVTSALKRMGGYDYEVAIPIEYINEAQGGDARSLRINFTQIDRDSDGTTRYSWRPTWTSPASYNGSGTFSLR